MEKTLQEILKDIQEQKEQGDRKGLTSSLRLLSAGRIAYFHQSEQAALQDEYADALYKTLLLELDEEEEDSIEIAELAYLSLGAIFRQAGLAGPEHYKRRLLLLHYFCDFFTDAIIEVFLAAYRKENMLQARSLALECLEKMQLSDMFYLEENEEHFIDGDEQLADACNAIEADANLSETDRQQAVLLHRVLYAYLRAKYKN